MSSATNKRMIDASTLPSNQLFDVWEGKATDYGVGFCALISPNFTYFLYRDGALTPIKPDVPKIFPFAPNPKKKPLFFQKSRVRFAKLICISKSHQIKTTWQIGNIFIMHNNKAYSFAMSGSAWLQVAPSDAHRFSALTVSKFENWNDFECNIKNKISETVSICMESIPLESYLPDDDAPTLMPNAKIAIGQELQQRLNEALSMAWGLSSIACDVNHIILQPK